MSKLHTIQILNLFKWYFSVAWYDKYNSSWSVRKLGSKRYAVDFGRLSFLFEYYNY